MAEHEVEKVRLTATEREALCTSGPRPNVGAVFAVERILAARLAGVEGWLRETTEAEWSEPCRLDHNGDCQDHGYFNGPCPIPAIRDYFGEAAVAEDQVRSAEVDEREALARRLVAERMAYYGYTSEQIEAASHHVDHYAAGCTITGPGSWDCSDECDRPNHPAHDEYDATAEFVVWVLDALNTPPALTSDGGAE